MRIEALEDKGAALTKVLACFEGVIATSQSADKTGRQIERMRVEPDTASGQYRYSILPVNSAGQTAKLAKRTLELLLAVRRESKNAIIGLPSKTEQGSAAYRLEIKHHQRTEGLFSVPVGGTLKSVEVRALQDGKLRARQWLTL